MAFGKKIAEHRQRIGMKQATLAERIGIGETHLSRIEQEKQIAPRLDTIFRMIQVLELTREEGIDLLLEAGYPAEFFTGSPILADLDSKQKLVESIEAIQNQLDLLKKRLVNETF